jgi:hypothetical protein
MAGEYTGKRLYFSLGGTVLSQGQRSLTVDEPGESVDATSGTAGYSYDLPTFVRGTIDIEVVDQGTVSGGGTTVWRALTPNQENLEFIYGPEGTASGKPKYVVNVMTNGRSRPQVYNNVVVIRGQLKYQGGPTEATW